MKVKYLKKGTKKFVGFLFKLILIFQLDSAATGREQFMYFFGQLNEQTNVLWWLDFEGYHGLRSVDDIIKISFKNVCCERLTKVELTRYYSLLKHVSPLMKNSVCFQLLSMIMLFDTSNLVDIEMEDIPSNIMEHDFECSCSSLSSTYIGSGLNASKDISQRKYCGNSVADDKCEIPQKKKPGLEERFKEINVLQKHYIELFKTHCERLDDPKINSLVENDKRINNIMLCLRQIAQYVPALM